MSLHFVLFIFINDHLQNISKIFAIQVHANTVLDAVNMKIYGNRREYLVHIQIRVNECLYVQTSVTFASTKSVLPTSCKQHER